GSTSGPGLLIQNIAGAVEVTDGVYNDNAEQGISITNADSATIAGPMASGNTTGLLVSNVGPVEIVGGTYFQNGAGVLVVDVDSVSVSNTNVSDNPLDGLRAQNLAGAVSVADSTFNLNGVAGVRVLNADSVSLSNVTANGNDSNGVVAAGIIG